VRYRGWKKEQQQRKDVVDSGTGCTHTHSRRRQREPVSSTRASGGGRSEKGTVALLTSSYACPALVYLIRPHPLFAVAEDDAASLVQNKPRPVAFIQCTLPGPRVAGSSKGTCYTTTAIMSTGPSLPHHPRNPLHLTSPPVPFTLPRRLQGWGANRCYENSASTPRRSSCATLDREAIFAGPRQSSSSSRFALTMFRRGMVSIIPPTTRCLRPQPVPAGDGSTHHFTSNAEPQAPA